MHASQKMAQRVVLHRQLLDIDDDLAFLFGERSIRASSKARDLLTARANICDELLLVGYQPWAVPVDLREAKVG